MLEWAYRIADRVDELAKLDREYQDLARQQEELVGAFDEFLARLGEEDREMLLEYMDVIGNMQYRRTQLAWLYGKLHPHD